MDPGGQTTTKGASRLRREGASHLLDGAPVRRLGGAAGALSAALSVGLSGYALYWVLFIVQPQVYRVSFLLIALVLTFLLFPSRRGDLRGVSALDWLFIALSLGLPVPSAAQQISGSIAGSVRDCAIDFNLFTSSTPSDNSNARRHAAISIQSYSQSSPPHK
jgi:hypothetical protein